MVSHCLFFRLVSVCVVFKFLTVCPCYGSSGISRIIIIIIQLSSVDLEVLRRRACFLYKERNIMQPTFCRTSRFLDPSCAWLVEYFLSLMVKTQHSRIETTFVHMWLTARCVLNTIHLAIYIMKSWILLGR